jgi:hypothetical protein
MYRFCLVFHDIPTQAFGQTPLFQLLSVQPRLTREPKPDEKHIPFVTQTSPTRQQWETSASGSQGFRPVAFDPSGK